MSDNDGIDVDDFEDDDILGDVSDSLLDPNMDDDDNETYEEEKDDGYKILDSGNAVGMTAAEHKKASVKNVARKRKMIVRKDDNDETDDEEEDAHKKKKPVKTARQALLESDKIGIDATTGFAVPKKPAAAAAKKPKAVAKKKQAKKGAESFVLLEADADDMGDDDFDEDMNTEDENFIIDDEDDEGEDLQDEDENDVVDIAETLSIKDIFMIHTGAKAEEYMVKEGIKSKVFTLVYAGQEREQMTHRLTHGKIKEIAKGVESLLQAMPNQISNYSCYENKKNHEYIRIVVVKNNDDWHYFYIPVKMELYLLKNMIMTQTKGKGNMGEVNDILRSLYEHAQKNGVVCTTLKTVMTKRTKGGKFIDHYFYDDSEAVLTSGFMRAKHKFMEVAAEDSTSKKSTTEPKKKTANKDNKKNTAVEAAPPAVVASGTKSIIAVIPNISEKTTIIKIPTENTGRILQYLLEGIRAIEK